jgi:xylan 1,4-beta-xylosidase
LISVLDASLSRAKGSNRQTVTCRRVQALKRQSIVNRFIQITILCCVECGSSTATVIQGNAKANVSQSGQNDIEVLRNYCRGSGRTEANEGTGKTTARYMAQLGLKKIRGVNVDNTDSGNRIDSRGRFIPGPVLESVLADAKTYGYTPHIVVGQQRPGYLQPQAWAWSARTWQSYKEYAYKFVRYVAQDYQGSGFPTSFFEVTIELDIGANPITTWTQQFPGNNGSRQSYEHLKTIYGIWQAAVTRVAKENVARTVLVGGPAITDSGVFYAGFNWQNAFIDDVANNRWRLDAYTFHSYGDNAAVGSSPAHPDFGYLKDNLQALRIKLKSRGLNPRIAVTEWGPSSFADDSKLGRINYTHEGAAWTIAFFHDAISQGMHDAVQLIMRDNRGAETTGKRTCPSLLHMSNRMEYPKPTYNACKMFSFLPGDRKMVSQSSNQPDLVAIASASSNSAGIIIANYKYLFDYSNRVFKDLSTPKAVNVQFNNLPFSGRAVVQRYLIDANTSNLARYLDAEQRPDYGGTNLQKVEETNVIISKGTVILPQVTLGKSAVSLWIIQPKQTISKIGGSDKFKKASTIARRIMAQQQ